MVMINLTVVFQWVKFTNWIKIFDKAKNSIIKISSSQIKIARGAIKRFGAQVFLKELSQ